MFGLHVDRGYDKKDKNICNVIRKAIKDAKDLSNFTVDVVQIFIAGPSFQHFTIKPNENLSELLVPVICHSAYVTRPWH